MPRGFFQSDPSLISEEQACENSLGMKEIVVFGKLFYTVVHCDFSLGCVQGIFEDWDYELEW